MSESEKNGQLARFKEAVERKSEAAEAASRQPAAQTPAQEEIEGDQHSIRSDSRRTQDVFSVRDKNSGHGHKTADKWNQ